MACDIDTLLAAACTNKFTCLPNQRSFDVVLAQLLCEISQAGGGAGLSGAGSPEGVVSASPGVTYTDTSNGDLYTKQTGTGNTGWVLVSGASGGSGLAGAGAPEGVVTASPGTTYVDTVTDGFYVKKTGVGNTGWLTLII